MLRGHWYSVVLVNPTKMEPDEKKKLTEFQKFTKPAALLQPVTNEGIEDGISVGMDQPYLMFLDSVKSPPVDR